VVLLGGNYVRTNSLNLTSADSGEVGASVIWQAAKSQRVRLLGGRSLAGFRPVTNAGVPARLPEGARSHVLQLELNSIGITRLGEMKSRGFARSTEPAHCELFYAGKPMTLARWPNEGEWEHIAGFPATDAHDDGHNRQIGKIEAGFFYAGERIKGCATCQMSKINTNPSKPALFPITPEPNALPFQTISLDFIVKLPESEGFDTILTITDHDCSKAAMFMPCNETVDAAGVAKLYATYVFPHYGLPKKVISDRDPRFASNFSREMCNLLGIKQNISTAYHPQTDGQSERTNQSLEQYLRLYCGTHQKDWAAWLPLAQYTRNSWPNASTKKTPYELILGYTPLAHQPSRDTATIPDIDTRMKLINNAREQAQEALKQTQATMIKETRFKEFEIGQKVWLEGKNIKRPYDSPKLSPKQYGPFRVVAKISPVAYKLQIPATWQVHDVFHASLLTPYKETVEHGKNFLEPPPDIIEGEEEWEVEQILDKRIFGRSKKLQFLVRWKGYSPAHDQWVNKEDMAADDLVRIFEWENPHDARCNAQPGARGLGQPTVDFDSPDITSSREASVEPAGISAARTRTHWAHSLDQKERTRINGLVLLARAAVAFRAKHGKFPRKLRRGFFNLVHRLARIEGKLTAYPADFTAKGLRED